MTHVSGLRPDVDLHPWTGYDAAIELAKDEVPTSAPGETFVYSDINFFLLGDIVARVTRAVARRVSEGARVRAARHDRDRLPAAEDAAAAHRADRALRRAGRVAVQAARCGAAARRRARSDRAPHGRHRRPRRPVQHRARSASASRGCCSARAGSARTRVLSAATRDGDDLAADAGRHDAAFAASAGTSTRRTRAIAAICFRSASYGHTGFTGTSLWIDPASNSYVIFLSSRLHPDGDGDVGVLRSRIATVAAAAICRVDRRHDRRTVGVDRRVRRPTVRTLVEPPSNDRRTAVLTGIDVLARDGFKQLRGKRVGLITNHTGRSRDGDATIDLLHKAPGVKLVSLFSPEHGIRGVLDADVPAEKDEKTGLPIHSLFYKGGTGRPLEGSLAGIDTLVDRSAGHRRALLHLPARDGLRDGGGGEATRSRWSCSIGRIRSTAGRSKARCRASRAQASRRTRSSPTCRCRSATA